jgi:thioredoxin 1
MPSAISRRTSNAILTNLTKSKGVSVGATKIVTDASFADDVLMSDKPVLVDFWAEWCGPCKMVAPILEEIAAENDGIVIAKLNVDENPQIAASFGITSIPTMNVFQGGQVVKSIIGAKPKAALLADLAPYL